MIGGIFGPYLHPLLIFIFRKKITPHAEDVTDSAASTATIQYMPRFKPVMMTLGTLALIGNVLTTLSRIYDSYPVLLVGRFFFGMTSGAVRVVSPRYAFHITSPPRAAVCVASVQGAAMLGSLSMTVYSVLVLPKDNEYFDQQNSLGLERKIHLLLLPAWIAAFFYVVVGAIAPDKLDPATLYAAQIGNAATTHLNPQSQEERSDRLAVDREVASLLALNGAPVNVFCAPPTSPIRISPNLLAPPEHYTTGSGYHYPSSDGIAACRLGNHTRCADRVGDAECALVAADAPAAFMSHMSGCNSGHSGGINNNIISRSCGTKRRRNVHEDDHEHNLGENIHKDDDGGLNAGILATVWHQPKAIFIGLFATIAFMWTGLPPTLAFGPIYGKLLVNVDPILVPLYVTIIAAATGIAGPFLRRGCAIFVGEVGGKGDAEQPKQKNAAVTEEMEAQHLGCCRAKLYGVVSGARVMFMVGIMMTVLGDVIVALTTSPRLGLSETVRHACCVAGFVMILTGTNGLLGTVFYELSIQLFPKRFQGAGSAILVSVLNFVNGAINVVFPVLVSVFAGTEGDELQGLSSVFSILAGIGALAAIISFAFLHPIRSATSREEE